MSKFSSPHIKAARGTSSIMLLVIIACIPATVALYTLFGVGVLINLLLCSVTALITESLFMVLRKRSIVAALRDNSALLTAVLLALAIPPLAPWWISVIGTIIAIALAKQLFGGLGMNIFNPAMVAYVVLLISFPLQMSAWPAPQELAGLIEAKTYISAIFGGGSVDAYTMATPLDVLRHNEGLTMEELYSSNSLLSTGKLAGYSSELVNIAFLIGGLYLIKKKVTSYHAPLGMLIGLTVVSFLFSNGSGSDSNGSPIFHLFSGATMMAAFFIITDPVSCCTSNRGRFIFGLLVGLLTYLIRTWGNYPDGVAFAVILANICAPFIDYYTVPRSYGREHSEAIIKRGEQ